MKRENAIHALTWTSIAALAFAALNMILTFVVVAVNWKHYSDFGLAINFVTVAFGFIGLFAFIIAFFVSNELKEK